jgi:hypothetical protein
MFRALQSFQVGSRRGCGHGAAFVRTCVKKREPRAPGVYYHIETFQG